MADESGTRQDGITETLLRHYHAGPNHSRQGPDNAPPDMPDEPPGSNIHTPNRPLSPVSEEDETDGDTVAGGGGGGQVLAYERVPAGEENPRKMPRISHAKVNFNCKPTWSRAAWQPFFPQRWVLIVFLAIFLMLVSALEAIHILSDRNNNGLTTSTSSMRYPWMYGPATVFTILVALWRRVDYQARLTRPWYHASEAGDHDDAKMALLMDYVSMFSLAVPFRVAVKGDWIVAATPPSRSFSPSEPFLSTGSLPYFSEDVNYNLTFPEGTSDQSTYQPVAADLSAISKLNATVEGLAVGLDCQPASVTSVNTNSDGGQEEVEAVSGCGLSNKYSTNFDFTATAKPSYVAFFFPDTCQSSTGGANDIRIGLLVAELKYTIFNNTGSNAYEASGAIPRSAQLICSPSYNISDIDLIKTAPASLDCRHSNTTTRTLSNARAVDIMEATFSAADGAGLESILSLLGNLFFTDPAATGLLTTQQSLFTENSPLQQYCAQTSTLVIQRNLMEATSTLSIGSAIIQVERLLVQNLACQLMAGLCPLSAVMVVGILVMRPRNTPPSALRGPSSAWQG